MSRREARDKIVRVFEITIEVIGFVLLLLPLLQRKPKKRNRN